MNFCKTVPCTIDAPGFSFKDPVAVDIRTGKVYKVASENGVLVNVPIYDSPVMITEKMNLTLQ